MRVQSLPMRSHLRNLLREETGSNLVEMAISLTVLLSVVSGIMGMSMLAYAKQFVTMSARQATRYAMVRGSTFSATACSGGVAYGCQAAATDVTSYVKSLVPLGLATANTSVSTSWPGVTGANLSCLSLNGNNSVGCVVQVTVSYSFSFGLPFLPTGATTLQSTSAMVIMQ